MARKLSRKDRDRIEAEALKLYDELNPRPFSKINVPKDECIKRAREKLKL